MNKLLSCRFNMDTNRVEARFEGGTTLAIDCIAVENEYGNTPEQRAELGWLLYNKPLEYAQMVLGGEIEHYLSAVRQAGLVAQDVEIRKADLDDLFLEIMHQHRGNDLPAAEVHA